MSEYYLNPKKKICHNNQKQFHLAFEHIFEFYLNQ